MNSKTVSYSEDLYSDVTDHMVDYHQLGETVCGAEDPAVITIVEGLGVDHPELEGFNTVRVTERYVNSGRSDTFLEFSNRDITDEEYALADIYLSGE